MEFPKMNPIEENGSESAGKSVARAPNKGSFTSESQPSGEQKSRGWWKKKKGRFLMQALLNLDFNGTQIDPETQQKQENQIKKQASAYFNIPEAFITNEMIMNMKQMAKAINTGDTQAFNSVMDRAYGKPKEHIEVEEVKAPQLVFNYGKIGMPDPNTGQPITEDGTEVPPIANSEEEIENEK